MPTSCFVGGCKMYSTKDSGIRFFHLPKEELMREIWIRNINRAPPKSWKNVRICGRHFVDGQPTPQNPFPILHMNGFHLIKRHLEENKGQIGAVREEIVEDGQNCARNGDEIFQPAIRAIPNSPPLVKKLKIGVYEEANEDEDELPPPLPPLFATIPNKELVSPSSSSAQQPKPTKKPKKKKRERKGKLMHWEWLEGDDQATRYYTGVHSFDMLANAYEEIAQQAARLALFHTENPKTRLKSRKLDIRNEFLLTLIKHHRKYDGVHLGHIYGINDSYVSRLLAVWIPFLKNNLKADTPTNMFIRALVAASD